jgi:hypothetical protein
VSVRKAAPEGPKPCGISTTIIRGARSSRPTATGSATFGASAFRLAVPCESSAAAIVPDRFIAGGALWRAVPGMANEGTFGGFDLLGIGAQNQHLDEVQSGNSVEPVFEPILIARSIAGRGAHRSFKHARLTLVDDTLEQGGTTPGNSFL